MTFVFMFVHFLITLLLIAGILIQTAKSEGMGALGGGGGVFRSGDQKGFEGFLDKWMTYLAWGFLASSFLSALVVPRFL